MAALALMLAVACAAFAAFGGNTAIHHYLGAAEVFIGLAIACLAGAVAVAGMAWRQRDGEG